MPRLQAHDPTQFIEASGIIRPSNFTGIITQALCAPMLMRTKGLLGAFEARRTGEAYDEGLFEKTCFKLGLHLHYQPNEGESDDEGNAYEPFYRVYDMAWLNNTITCSPKYWLENGDAVSSDIEWPGSPEFPNGLDDVEFLDAAHDLYEYSQENLESEWSGDNDPNLYDRGQAFEDALRKRFGGEPFWVGRQPSSGKDPQAQKDTEYHFFIGVLQSHNNFAPPTKGDIPIGQLYEGITGHFDEREWNPSWAKKPINVLVVERFDGYVESAEVDSSTSSNTSSNVPTNQSDDSTSVREVYEGVVIEALSEHGELKFTELRKLTRHQALKTKEMKTAAFALLRDKEFMSGLGEWDGKVLK